MSDSFKNEQLYFKVYEIRELKILKFECMKVDVKYRQNSIWIAANKKIATVS